MPESCLHGILLSLVPWTRSFGLVFLAAATVFHDGWTTTDAGCRRYGDGTDDSASLRNALYCERLSWRGSREAALRSALIYANQGQAASTRRVLTPFEAIDDPRTLYILGWADSKLGDRKLALEERRRAFESVRNVGDLRVRANAANLYSYELQRETKYEEAVRILNELFQTPGAETLGLEYVRDAHLQLALSLVEMGDIPAATAELERLRTRLGTLPMQPDELILDARLHIERGELQSADELLVQAERAAGEGERWAAASALTDRLEIAVRQGNTARVHALLSELEGFKDAIGLDSQLSLVILQGTASRGEGKLNESRAFLERALAMSPPPNVLWEIQYELGLTLKAEGRLDEAQSFFEASISEVEAQRGRLLDPAHQPALIASRQQPYDGLFDLLAEKGDSEGALAILQKSLASRLDSDVADAASTSGPAVEDALRRSEARRALSQASAGLTERQANSAASGARFVAWVTTDAHAWAVVHEVFRTQVEPIPLPPKELCTLMQKFSEDFDESTATRLGNALLPPARLARLGLRFAVILPGCARNFPVAALRVGTGRLIDQAIISVAPDVSTVARVGAVGVPVSPKGDVFADPKGDLPSARLEAEWTGRMTGASVRLGEMASEATLAGLGFRQLLHFATHTEVEVAGPALVLADKNLTVADILQHRIRADLVVLASCHSGSSLRTTAAETLSTAFLRAGSGAVLATLRSVEDRLAFDVIRAFYEAGGLADPAGALARVQRQLAHSEPPSQWAAFFVAGSAEALTAPRAVRLAQHSGG